ncbi:MAG: hypothetical protein V7696_12390 [Halioglobus sp.]
MANRKGKKQSRHPGSASAPAIISPWFDFFCVGGLSILLMAGLLVYIFFRKSGGQGEIYFGSFIILQAMINWPHFMASYRLLYKPSTNIRKHPYATVFVPILLVLAIIAAVALGSKSAQDSNTILIQQDIAYYMWLISAFYLAWHYTGQAWGMIASFSYLAGIKITDEEKLILRSGLRILLVWHVVWGVQDLPRHWLGPVYPYLPSLLNVVSACAIAAFIIGAMTFVGIKRRTGQSPTPQMLAPWLAVYLWYLVLNFEPNAYLFVQLSHALQYLIFPLRIELNRSQSDVTKGAVIRQVLWSSRYYMLLVLAGLTVFYFPDLMFGDRTQVYGFALLIASAVSIHHYFVDGCIWKISNKEVRSSLFSHVGR